MFNRLISYLERGNILYN